MKKRLQQRWFLNLALLVVVAALLLIAYVGEAPEEEEPKQVRDYLPADINQIAIDRPGKKAIRFKQENNKWLMTEPYSIGADENMLGRLLAITHLQVGSILDNEKLKMENIGLAQPLATVTFNDIPVTFGDTQPVGQLRYVKLDKHIMLITDQHVNELNAGSIAYIDRQLVPTGVKINRLTINDREIDISEDTGVVDQWSSIKASWLSHAPEIPSTGIDINISLQNNSNIRYLAERRENDVVLVNPDYQFEYHLPVHVMGTLGITFPTDETTTPDAVEVDPLQ